MQGVLCPILDLHGNVDKRAGGMDTLAITSIFTKSYAYAVRSQLSQIQKNLAAFNPFEKVFYIYVTDEARPDLAEYGKELMPAVEFINLVGDYKEAQNYKPDAQKMIARMMAAAFNKAVALGVDYVWNVESDVLPQFNNLRSLYGTLAFDDGYYSIAFCPYISQGKGGLLGGFGDHNHWILPDVYEDEREIPAELIKELKEHREKQPKDKKPSDEWIKEMQRIEEEVKKCPPNGNIFARQSKGFRRRGWGQDAMPQSARGMIWEVDWIGTGNVLLNKKALHATDFIGYERAGGTQDLFLCFRKWKASGLRIACIPHSPCHHVTRHEFKEGDKVISPYTTIVLYHEEVDPNCKGHLRHREEPFYEF